MAQRWLVVSSKAAMQRAEKSVNKAREREFEAIEKQLFHLQARRFESEQSAQAQGLMMVMTLALLVYSVAQRRLRQELARQKEGLDHGIGHSMIFEVDSKALVPAPPSSISPQTSNVVSDQKSAPLLSSHQAG